MEALGKEANACLIHSHGAVCLGADMERGPFKTAAVLEVTASDLLHDPGRGGENLLASRRENIAAMKEFVKNSYGQDK